MKKWIKTRFLSIISGLLFFIVTLVISYHNYLLFHSLAEGLSVFISFTVFVIAWHSRDYTASDYLKILGLAYLFIGFLDFLHTLAYKGMSIFTDYDYYANQLWIAARYFESIIILVAMNRLGRKGNLNLFFLTLLYGLITTLIIFSIFFSDIFPVCFIEGQGQTTFKIMSEYTIVVILVIALVVIIKKKKQLETNVFRYMCISIVLTILSELTFTLYIDNYGLSNLVGHYLKILSFYYIYRAIVVTGIRDPYSLIFKELTDRNIEMNVLNKQIKESVEIANNANESKSKYLSMMSHEMRTPLNGILGFAQLLQRSELNNEQIEYVNVIGDSAKSLRTHIDHILDEEKYLSKEMIFSDKIVRLKTLVERKMLFFNKMCEEKGLDYSYEIHIDENLYVLIDEERYLQLINNFIGNAIKFTDVGKVGFEIHYELKEKKVKLLISISDTGIGMDKEEQKLLFEPFVQLSDSHSNPYGGSGLGLSISKEIVDHYNGTIDILSQQNQGSTFAIILWLETQ